MSPGPNLKYWGDVSPCPIGIDAPANFHLKRPKLKVTEHQQLPENDACLASGLAHGTPGNSSVQCVGIHWCAVGTRRTAAYMSSLGMATPLLVSFYSMLIAECHTAEREHSKNTNRVGRER